MLTPASGSILDGDRSPSDHSYRLLAETEAHTLGCLLGPCPRISCDKNLNFFFLSLPFVDIFLLNQEKLKVMGSQSFAFPKEGGQRSPNSL